MKHAMSAMDWAQQQFGESAIADPRWTHRLVVVAAQVARSPGGKVSEVFRNDAERQGAYGLLESRSVAAEQVAHAMFKACGRCCADEEFVFCAVDGTSLTLADGVGTKGFGPIGSRAGGARGLKVINGLVLSRKGVPLGLSAQVWWARPPKRRKAKHRDKLKPEEKEIGHWLEVMANSEAVVESEAPDTRLWFQLDREGDAWPILVQADQNGHFFTVRANHNRRVISPDGDKTYLHEVLARQAEAKSYKLAVTAGPNRAARTAHMVVRAVRVPLQFRDKSTGRRFPKEVNVVLAKEAGTTPEGEKPISWMLLTNRPIATTENLDQIIFGYAQRWKIEEFHRTWKSGACRVEDTQLRSMESVIKWATILAAVAVRVERIKLLARSEPQRPATDEFKPIELRAIALLRFGKQGKKRLADNPTPTIAEATLWLAQLGGYTGKSSGGPPGSIVLARGLQELAAAVRTLEALK
jgi:Transposase DNA-binding/Transposase DDE domain